MVISWTTLAQDEPNSTIDAGEIEYLQYGTRYVRVYLTSGFCTFLLEKESRD